MYFEEAKKRLEEEAKSGKFGQKEAAMKSAVKDALVYFCEQDEEFAQAVVQGGSFAECMAEVAKGVGGSISDLDAYKRRCAFTSRGRRCGSGWRSMCARTASRRRRSSRYCSI